MNDQIIDIDEVSVSSNSKDLKLVIKAVNAAIRTDTLKLANRDGVESPAIPEYSPGELLQKYHYKCKRIRPQWFQHTFKLKPTRL